MTKLAAFVVSLVAALGFMAAPVAAQDGRILTGMARVIDSDRIQIGDQIIRLFGIDAMERDPRPRTTRPPAAGPGCAVTTV